MLTWRLFKWYANSYRHKSSDNESSLFEAKKFWLPLNIKWEKTELNLPLPLLPPKKRVLKQYYLNCAI